MVSSSVFVAVKSYKARLILVDFNRSVDLKVRRGCRGEFFVDPGSEKPLFDPDLEPVGRGVDRRDLDRVGNWGRDVDDVPGAAIRRSVSSSDSRSSNASKLEGLSILSFLLE